MESHVPRNRDRKAVSGSETSLGAKVTAQPVATLQRLSFHSVVVLIALTLNPSHFDRGEDGARGDCGTKPYANIYSLKKHFPFNVHLSRKYNP
ncbi:hypothetical protein E2C01_026389 [Portunus trituberculatus]|uniref:Uncharacterized protein n=1 Tax=Portunus trituberculatus TaxID=210409 RepID=A0A5B7EFA5_PORTR|nr:hypothetical protein [Portunus trituberculatus]